MGLSDPTEALGPPFTPLLLAPKLEISQKILSPPSLQTSPISKNKSNSSQKYTLSPHSDLSHKHIQRKVHQDLPLNPPFKPHPLSFSLEIHKFKPYQPSLQPSPQTTQTLLLSTVKKEPGIQEVTLLSDDSDDDMSPASDIASLTPPPSQDQRFINPLRIPHSPTVSQPSISKSLVHPGVCL